MALFYKKRLPSTWIFDNLFKYAGMAELADAQD